MGSRRKMSGLKACEARWGEKSPRWKSDTHGDFDNVLVSNERVVAFPGLAVDDGGHEDGSVHRVGRDDVRSFGRPSERVGSAG